MKKVNVRNSAINPFLLNPIMAVTLNNQDININHAIATKDGIIVIFEVEGKSSQLELSNIEFLNQHEFERFQVMLKKLSIRGYLKASDTEEYGFSI